MAAIVEACESLVDKLVRNRRGERTTFGSYVFDADGRRTQLEALAASLARRR